MPPRRSLPVASAVPAEPVSDPEAPEPARRRGERWALAALLAGAVGIAFAPIFVRLSELPPTATAFHRLFLALPALWLWKTIEDRRAKPNPAPPSLPQRPRRWNDATLLAAAGLFFAGDLALWHWSIRFTSVANATCSPTLPRSSSPWPATWSSPSASPVSSCSAWLLPLPVPASSWARASPSIRSTCRATPSALRRPCSMPPISLPSPG